MKSSNKNETPQGVVTKKNGYQIEAKYSQNAIEKKLVRFTKGKESFEISAGELIELLATQVSQETLAPTFVDTTRVNVVKVKRQIAVRVNRDIKLGEEIRIDYEHAYPLEFAIIEEAWKLCLLNKEAGVTELTKEMIDKCKAQMEPGMKDYLKQFYKNTPSLNVDGKK